MWKPFFYISNTHQWCFVSDEASWLEYKNRISFDPNTPEDLYAAGEEFRGKEEKHPVFTIHCAVGNRGTKTLGKFFQENGMRW